MFRVIIAGSRDFDNYKLLENRLDLFLSNKKDEGITIISGTARGADSLGELYAHNKGYELSRYPADWSKYGKKAGYIRNVEMSNNADACVVFWDGKSKGTKHMIDIATKKELPLRIVKF